MAYIHPVIEKLGQGMVYSPDWSDEQGGVYPKEEDVAVQELEDWQQLKRYPSNSNFDKECALMESFGLKKNKNKNKLVADAFQESEQLGIIIDSTVQNEMERLSLDLNEASEQYWPNTDTEFLQNSFKTKDVMPEEPAVGAELFVELDAVPKLADVEIDHKFAPNEEIKGAQDSYDLVSQEDLSTNKEIRWRKEDDKELFSSFRKMCRKAMFNLRDVVSAPLRKNKAYKQIILEVAQQVGWKGKTSMVVRRIKKILNNSELSVREKQDLTRMYKQQVKEGQLDWEKILYEFPGKNLIFVKEFWKTIKVKVHPELPAMTSDTFDFDVKVADKLLVKPKVKKKKLKEEKLVSPNLNEVGDQGDKLKEPSN